MSRLLYELGLKDTAIALEESLDKLNTLACRIETVRGVNQSMALEAQQLVPGFLNPSRPIGYFSVTPSKTQYRTSLEEISQGMWAAIAIAIAAAFGVVIGLIFALVGDDSGVSAGGKTPALDKAVNNNEKVAEAVGQSDEAIDAISHARGGDLENAVKDAFTARFLKVANEDITSHSHTSLASFSKLDADMLHQHGIYSFLYADRDLARNVNTLLKPAINDSDRIVDEFDKTTPDYKSIAEAIKRMQGNRSVNDDYEEGLSFSDYVQMIVNHREANDTPLEIKTLGDFTELLRGLRQYSQKSCDFFRQLLKGNSDVLEHLAHDAKALAKRSEKMRSGVSGGGTQEDSRTLVMESQRLIMETCKSLRALGSYVHLTIWCSNRHAKFVMFLHTSLHGILLEAKAALKAKDVEVPDYFEDAIKSMSKKK